MSGILEVMQIFPQMGGASEPAAFAPGALSCRDASVHPSPGTFTMAVGGAGGRGAADRVRNFVLAADAIAGGSRRVQLPVGGRHVCARAGDESAAPAVGALRGTFHIIQQPTYQSKYPPGQGLLLALGQILGNPILGAWIGVSLGCVATWWMLRAFLPAAWALAGGLIIGVLPLTLFWGTNYWGAAWRWPEAGWFWARQGGA